ncbi:MAG: iron-containing alcohol dehydrogenase [Eubacterium sp.]|nr:iron-containing alcohol dehydrogenase [Eubacterium sp.]
MSTKIYRDRDAVVKNSSAFKELGSRALIVTGKHSAAKNGSLDDVKTALDKEGIGYVIYNDIEENPSVETCFKAAKTGTDAGCDFVIGIGGGSPMDAAKAAALIMKNPDMDEAKLYDKSLKLEALPVAEIPTTCGTGSEVTGVSVISVPGKRTKCSLPHKIFPEVAFLDAKYLLAAPVSIIRSTSIDALGHIFESYINTAASEESKAVGVDGLKIWAASKDVIFGTEAKGKTGADMGFSYEVLDSMLLASNYAGFAIKGAGTSAPHALSYRQTFEFGVQHGKAIGHFQAGYLKYADKGDQEILLGSAGFRDFDEFEEFIAKECAITEAPKDRVDEVKLQSVEEMLADEARLARIPYKVDRAILMDIAGLKA